MPPSWAGFLKEKTECKKKECTGLTQITFKSLKIYLQTHLYIYASVKQGHLQTLIAVIHNQHGTRSFERHIVD